jgi:hypothetical protein
MNRVLPVLLVVAVLIVAFLISRPKPSPVTAAPGALEVAPLTLSGAVASPSSDVPVRVAALIGGTAVADSPVTGDTYKLELPGTVGAPLSTTANISLLHGEARLPNDSSAAEVQILLYQDANKNALYDPGEAKLEPALLQSGKDPALQGFFGYKILLLSTDETLKENQDNPTGAKNFYRYDITMKRGYNILEGEFASSGYEMRAVSGTNWDLLLPMSRGGKGGPPGFTP